MATADQEQLVSVIVPTYNREKYISRALNSLYRQTHRPIEVVVVDDCSSDNTEEVVHEWAEEHDACEREGYEHDTYVPDINDRDISESDINEHDPRDAFVVRYFRLDQNSGACVARNKGLDEARGRYIQYLDSDDYLEPGKFSDQIERMENEQTPICLCDFQFVGPEGEVIERRRNNKPLKKIIRKFLSASIMTPLIDTQRIGKSVRWNMTMNRNQDMEYLLRIYSLCETSSYLPGYYCNYVLHQGEQISDSYSKGPQYNLIGRSIRRHIKDYYFDLSSRRIMDLLMLLKRLKYLKLKSWVYGKLGIEE